MSIATGKALDRLRAQARLTTMFAPVSLPAALQRLGFVQADPIRAPARAQDLILRHRVTSYRAGDLERQFARLKLEEDFLYAYGFMPQETRALLHPRRDPAHDAAGHHTPSGLAAEVLAFVQAQGQTHPRDLEERFGRDRAVNGWGGFSKATTRALEELRHYGLLRVAHRRDGIRIYEPAETLPATVAAERARRLVLLVARILAPVSAVSLRGALALVARRNPGLGALAPLIPACLAAGELLQEEAEGETYLWPAAEDAGRHASVPQDVRLLAPFDPVVWDRRRFEHLWAWSYRFEAYTPPAKRIFGYYALPLLWGDRVIGCANVTLPGGRLDVAIVYARPAPRSIAFTRALDAELARMQRFLTPLVRTRLTRTAAPDCYGNDQ